MDVVIRDINYLRDWDRSEDCLQKSDDVDLQSDTLTWQKMNDTYITIISRVRR
ncbi:MAG: hypothetical protein OXC30_03940 [Alphaproteobacteria bacterium]|nr:hypothetical protein [Alphaproteobacteria bacterium]